ncbi:helix-turn-helix domain-containing protein [Streptomyces griseiscabiei]|uniref:helix-turn-helix domain-containing protein n=1 Tax=Streptomyces griseiscabiei TaxID=2993540 RepID=UPI00211B1E47|nr:helix-turn-helix domain-containing protein [Streptomyces griseiscabiei]
MAARVGLSPATVSHHVAVLRESGLLTSRRIGGAVLHTPTTLGLDLLQDGGAGPAEQRGEGLVGAGRGGRRRCQPARVVGHRMHQHRGQRTVLQHDRAGPAEERGDDPQTPAVQMQIAPQMRAGDVQHRRRPAHTGMQPLREPREPGPQQRPGRHRPGLVEAGPDMGPVRGDEPLVMPPDQPGEPAQRLGVAVGERARPAGQRAGEGQLRQIGPQPGPGCGEQRVQARVEAAGRAARGQEVRRVAARRREMAQPRQLRVEQTA